MKTRLILIALLAAVLWSGGSGRAASAAEWSARVVWVLDGDSIIVRRQGREITIRLEGIDAPEKGQLWAERARTFLRDHVYRHTVRIRVKEKDRYGRTVARVILDDGREMGPLLVRAGLAWWYRRFSRDPALERAEKAARAERIGLWSGPDPVAPWQWKKQRRRSKRGK